LIDLLITLERHIRIIVVGPALPSVLLAMAERGCVLSVCLRRLFSCIYITITGQSPCSWRCCTVLFQNDGFTFPPGPSRDVRFMSCLKLNLSVIVSAAWRNPRRWRVSVT